MALDPNITAHLSKIIDDMTKYGNASIVQGELKAKMDAAALRIGKDSNALTEEFNRGLKKASQATSESVRNLGKQVDLSAKMVTNSIDSFSSVDVAAKHLSKQLKAGLSQIGVDFAKYGKSIESLEDVLEFKDGIAALEKLVEAQLMVAQQHEGYAEALSDAKKDILQSDLPDYFHEMAKSADGSTDSISGNVQSLTELTSIQGKSTQAHKEFGIVMADSSKALLEAMKSRASAFFSLSNAMETFKSAITIGVKSTMAQIQYGSNLSVTEFEKASLKLGLQGPVLAELMEKFRQAGTALGGSGGFIDALDDNIDNLFSITGDRKTAALTAAKTLDILSMNGALTSASLKDMIGNFTNLKTMGVGTAESMSILNEMTQIGSTRINLLNAANDKERATILNSAVARVAEMKAIGMSTNQAISAAKALGMIKGQDIRQRFKQAARARMAMDSQGISGGADVQRIIMAGNRSKLGSGDGETLRRAMEALSLKAAAGREGSFGQEIYAERLLDKMGPMMQMIDPTTSPMINKLNKKRAIGDPKIDFTKLSTEAQTVAIEAALEKQTKALLGKTETGKMVMEADKLLQQRETAIGKTMETAFVIGGTLIGGIIAKKVGIFTKIGGMIKGILPGASSAIPKAAPIANLTGGGIMSKVGSAIGTAGGAIKGVASSVAGAGASAMASIAPTFAKVTGKTLLKSIPGLGLIAGLGLAAYRLSNGDYVGAGMEVASGVASTFPGAGTAASLAISGGLVARDLSNSGPDMATGTVMNKASGSPSTRIADMQSSNQTTSSSVVNTSNTVNTEAITVKALDSQATKNMASNMEIMQKSVAEMLTLQRDHYAKVEMIGNEANAESKVSRRTNPNSNRFYAYSG